MPSRLYEIRDGIAAQRAAAEISPTANALYMAGGDVRRLARTHDALVLMLRAIRDGYYFWFFGYVAKLPYERALDEPRVGEDERQRRIQWLRLQFDRLAAERATSAEDLNRQLELDRLKRLIEEEEFSEP